MFCEPVEPDELLKLITSLNNKSAGPDNVGPALLKDISPIILHPLLHIINLSFSTSMVPDKLKLARVIPVFKAGDGRLPLNYRPISLLSVFHKIIEKLMATRVTKFITATSVLYNIISLDSDKNIRLFWHLLMLLMKYIHLSITRNM